MPDSYRLPPVNISLIDDSGAFKEQARDTRRHFEKVNAERRAQREKEKHVNAVDEARALCASETAVVSSRELRLAVAVKRAADLADWLDGVADADEQHPGGNEAYISATRRAAMRIRAALGGDDE